ncbi:DNA alkylation repair protein [Chryseolinea sp. H1M3-3]|uniref:DNA alkylation repair protein n=1 Tax=Chryseolinea sp. H1M3-3 TaxID=3034144 RepID=UPI0023EE13D2|nr:DNA alkylation repair protein [Chryseolinea sp. H1M3-3]
MKSAFYREILHDIKKNSGKPGIDAFLNPYLGNKHPMYPITSPQMRKIAKDWIREHKDMPANEFAALITDLIEGKTFTEKYMAGILLDYAKADQKMFKPALFDKWLNHVEGWAEVDGLCTNKYSRTEIVNQWATWKPLLLKFSRSKNIQKRRASLVLFCSPLNQVSNMDMSLTALQNVDRLKNEKEVLITKAISWVLRSMVKLNREILEDYLRDNADTIPKIALRETKVKLETGRKTKKKLL